MIFTDTPKHTLDGLRFHVRQTREATTCGTGITAWRHAKTAYRIRYTGELNTSRVLVGMFFQV